MPSVLDGSPGGGAGGSATWSVAGGRAAHAAVNAQIPNIAAIRFTERL